MISMTDPFLWFDSDDELDLGEVRSLMSPPAIDVLVQHLWIREDASSFVIESLVTGRCEHLVAPIHAGMLKRFSRAITTPRELTLAILRGDFDDEPPRPSLATMVRGGELVRLRVKATQRGRFLAALEFQPMRVELPS